MDTRINYEKQTALLTQDKQHLMIKCGLVENDMKKLTENTEEKLKKMKLETDIAIS